MILGLVKSAFLVIVVMAVIAFSTILGVCYYQERAAQRRKSARNEYRRKHLEYLQKYNARLQ